MKVRVLVVEDDPIISQDLKEILISNGFEVIGLAPNYQKALDLYLTHRPHVLLVDIKLAGPRDGIELVKEIKKRKDSVFPVIYLTANSDPKTVSRAFDTNPSSFLTKPFSEKNLIVSIQLALNKHNKWKNSDQLESDLFIKVKDGYMRMKPSEIMYLKADGSYCRIVSDKGSYLISHNLSACMENLSQTSLQRVHRSYVINTNRISKIDGNTVHIGEDQLPIGRNYKSDLFEKIHQIK